MPNASCVGGLLTARQVEIVGILKEQCPGYAVMRRLSFGFRSILCWGKVTTLHRWLEEARKTGIHSLERLVRTIKQDLAAVESAVTEKWNNGPVEGQINRLKALKRQMYGWAGVDLLRARVLPLPPLEIQWPGATKLRKNRFKCRKSPSSRKSAILLQCDTCASGLAASAPIAHRALIASRLPAV